jgi:hypothetical protein
MSIILNVRSNPGNRFKLFNAHNSQQLSFEIRISVQNQKKARDPLQRKVTDVDNRGNCSIFTKARKTTAREAVNASKSAVCVHIVQKAMEMYLNFAAAWLPRKNQCRSDKVSHDIDEA